MKNKKGFTLIELLAVLAVLAILALISIPITIRIINNAREESYKRSIAAYGKAVEDTILEYLLDHDIDYHNISLNSDSNSITYNNSSLQIEYTGNTVTCSNLNFDTNGDVILRGCVTNNSKRYKYVNKHVEEDIYEIGDLIKVNGIEFYVIERSDSTKDYVTALKKEPLTVDELNATL